MPLHMSSVTWQAGSVTGMNFVICSFGNFQPGDRDEILETKPKCCHVNLFCLDYHSFVDSCNFANEANLKAEVFLWENFHPSCQDLGYKIQLGSNEEGLNHVP